MDHAADLAGQFAADPMMAGWSYVFEATDGVRYEYDPTVDSWQLEAVT
jgi:hypothetical protein